MGEFLTFKPVVPAVLLVLLTLGWWAVTALLYLRIGSFNRSARWTCLFARCAGIGILALIFLRPYARIAHEETIQRTVAVLVDTSASMALKDVDPKKSRLALVQEAFGWRGENTGNSAATQSAPLLTDHDSLHVKLFEFGGRMNQVRDPAALQATDPRTDSAQALEKLADALRNEDVSAVVMAGDGRQNPATPHAFDPVYALFSRRQWPVFTVGVGKEEFKDIALTAISSPQPAGRTVDATVTAAVRATGIPDQDVPVSVYRLTPGSKAESPKRIEPPVASGIVKLLGHEGKITLNFTPTGSGLMLYEIEAKPLASEAVLENNTCRFAKLFDDRTLHVLYLEGSMYQRRDGPAGDKTPWEHEFLKMALEEDGDVQVTCMFRDNDQGQASAAHVSWVKDPNGGYPKTLADLARYDVVIFSDIDMEYFTPEQLANTRDFVQNLGGGFIMVGGWTSFGPGGYDGSILDKLLPVDMLGRNDAHIDEDNVLEWEITDEGWKHPILQLDPDPLKNRDAWKKLPKFHGYNKVFGPKPAAQVLAVKTGSEDGLFQEVIVAVQPYGRGRSMAFTTDCTAGWGRDFEEAFGDNTNRNYYDNTMPDNRYYKKFWKNGIRWLAHARATMPKNQVTISLDKILAPVGTPVKIHALVLDESFVGVKSADVQAELTGPDGKKINVLLEPEPAENFAAGEDTAGRFMIEFTPDRPGEWRAEVHATIGGKKLSSAAALFTAVLESEEFSVPEQDRETLKALADATGGKYLPLAKVGQLPGLIDQNVKQRRNYTEHEIWDTPWLLVLAALAFSLEWLIRKQNGLA
ncbi:MAG TPA: glutamine amidotransferase [Planctomycetota bacterium]|nr:glutamine amidotransferase [Planctomycetota bacterium]